MVSVEAPGVQASSIEDAVTEDFDGFSTGVFTTLETAIGTITAADGRRFAVVGEDIYGGAGGVGRYLSVGVQSNSSGPALLTTSGGPQSYFGFWWSAADPWNEISFYSEGRMVATFNTAWVLATISQLPDAASYFGNPNDGSVPGQAYAYINVVFTDGAAYDAVAFSNLSPTISGFETDNWSTTPPESGTDAARASI